MIRFEFYTNMSFSLTFSRVKNVAYGPIGSGLLASLFEWQRSFIRAPISIPSSTAIADHVVQVHNTLRRETANLGSLGKGCGPNGVEFLHFFFAQRRQVCQIIDHVGWDAQALSPPPALHVTVLTVHVVLILDGCFDRVIHGCWRRSHDFCLFFGQ